jgi:heme/copper-type cytochrome/quinol oxidase subunit 2
MKKTVLSILFLLFLQMANAQCAMCRAVVESGSPSEAEGLNSGILYLMIFPYILIGTLFFFMIKYRITKNKNKEI